MSICSGKIFIIFTDNNPLSHLQTAKLGAVEQRWTSQLASFDFTAPGVAMVILMHSPDNILIVWYQEQEFPQLSDCFAQEPRLNALMSQAMRWLLFPVAPLKTWPAYMIPLLVHFLSTWGRVGYQDHRRGSLCQQPVRNWFLSGRNLSREKGSCTIVPIHRGVGEKFFSASASRKKC